MQYPGHIIKVGETDAAIVKAIKAKLNETLGAANDAAVLLDLNDPKFDTKMQQVVTLFQSRRVGGDGHPLLQDGEIGAVTWAALFGGDMVPSHTISNDALLHRVLLIAAGEEAKQVREVPVDSNMGPEVGAYLNRAGVPTGLSWCCAFVYWCFDEAALALKQNNPMFRTAGCLNHWHHAAAQGAQLILAEDAVANPAVVKAGMIFIMDHGGGLGHTGLVEKVEGGILTTIEGNTDASQTREGGGVYRLKRKITAINKGFIDYAVQTV